MAPELTYVLTLSVDLAEPVDLGKNAEGHRRFIPIRGGKFTGPEIKGDILPGGGDWNCVRPDGVVHVFAKYNLRTDDGMIIGITNEGYGRSSQEAMTAVFANDFARAAELSKGIPWYTKTWPRFQVAENKYRWLSEFCFLGDLIQPSQAGHVDIEVYQIV